MDEPDKIRTFSGRYEEAADILLMEDGPINLYEISPDFFAENGDRVRVTIEVWKEEGNDA